MVCVRVYVCVRVCVCVCVCIYIYRPYMCVCACQSFTHTRTHAPLHHGQVEIAKEKREFFDPELPTYKGGALGR